MLSRIITPNTACAVNAVARFGLFATGIYHATTPTAATPADTASATIVPSVLAIAPTDDFYSDTDAKGRVKPFGTYASCR